MSDEAKKAEAEAIRALVINRAERCGGDTKAATETLVQAGALKRDGEGRLSLPEPWKPIPRKG